jgi:hypothetical protein
MKRLVRLSAIDLEKLEEDYLRMIEKDNQSSFPSKEGKYKLPDNKENDDVKTFFPSPSNLVEYDDNLIDTNPRGGIPGPWAASMRWIGR